MQLQQVWVEPELRGRGYGRRGLADLCRPSSSRTPTVCLFVRPENAPAIALYEATGHATDDHVPLAHLRVTLWTNRRSFGALP